MSRGVDDADVAGAPPALPAPPAPPAPSAPRGPGRPPGSRNRNRLPTVVEAVARAQTHAPQPRRVVTARRGNLRRVPRDALAPSGEPITDPTRATKAALDRQVRPPPELARALGLRPGEQISRLQVAAEKLVDLACAGNLTAVKIIWESAAVWLDRSSIPTDLVITFAPLPGSADNAIEVVGEVVDDESPAVHRVEAEEAAAIAVALSIPLPIPADEGAPAGGAALAGRGGIAPVQGRGPVPGGGAADPGAEAADGAAGAASAETVI